MTGATARPWSAARPGGPSSWHGRSSGRGHSSRLAKRANTSQIGSKGAAEGRPFRHIRAFSWPEELPLQVFDRPLQGVDHARDARRNDLHASVAGDPGLVSRLHGCFDRRAVGRDGENDPVLVVEDRPDPELSIRHRLDHGLDLVVAPEVSLGLGSDPTDRLTELVEKGGWPSQNRP